MIQSTGITSGDLTRSRPGEDLVSIHTMKTTGGNLRKKPAWRLELKCVTFSCFNQPEEKGGGVDREYNLVSRPLLLDRAATPPAARQFCPLAVPQEKEKLGGQVKTRINGLLPQGKRSPTQSWGAVNGMGGTYQFSF